MSLILKSSSIALWYDMIHDAEASCSFSLHKEEEAYLVFLMIRYVNKPDIFKHIMASELLLGLALKAKTREVALQAVGDKCLLFSGFFPQLAAKRHVKMSYFINIGQTAYHTISKTENDLYDLLSQDFVKLTDILQSIRRYSDHYPDLLPLQAYELWNETGSQRAFSVLKKYTKGNPIKKNNF